MILQNTFFVYASQASGKSTFVRTSSSSGFRLVDYDDILLSYIGGDLSDLDDENVVVANEKAVIKFLQTHDKSQPTYIFGSFRLEETLNLCSYAIILDEAEIERRVDQRNKNGSRHTDASKVINQLKVAKKILSSNNCSIFDGFQSFATDIMRTKYGNDKSKFVVIATDQPITSSVYGDVVELGATDGGDVLYDKIDELRRSMRKGVVTVKLNANSNVLDSGLFKVIDFIDRPNLDRVPDLSDTDVKLIDNLYAVVNPGLVKEKITPKTEQTKNLDRPVYKTSNKEYMNHDHIIVNNDTYHNLATGRSLSEVEVESIVNRKNFAGKLWFFFSPHKSDYPDLPKSMQSITVDATIQAITQWQSSTFGHPTITGTWEHLLTELYEYFDTDFNDKLELADIFNLLNNFVVFHNWTWLDLLQSKLEILEQRKWVKKKDTSVVRHQGSSEQGNTGSVLLNTFNLLRKGITDEPFKCFRGYDTTKEDVPGSSGSTRIVWKLDGNKFLVLKLFTTASKQLKVDLATIKFWRTDNFLNDFNQWQSSKFEFKPTNKELDEYKKIASEMLLDLISHQK